MRGDRIVLVVVVSGMWLLAISAYAAYEVNTPPDTMNATFPDSGCEYHHTVSGGDDTADVYLCDEVSFGNESVNGVYAGIGTNGSWSGSIYISSESNNRMRTYIHELGHAMGMEHSESGIMRSSGTEYRNWCSLSDTTREIAQHWNTTEIVDSSCPYVDFDP